MKTLTVWFDYISPYAFLAWQKLPELAATHNLQLEPVPVFFGGMLKHHNLLGPAEIPVKRNWVYTDVLRAAAMEGLMMQFPPTHPFNPLYALRATVLVAQQAPDKLDVVITDLFAAAWQASHDLSLWKTVAGVLANHGLSFTEEACNRSAVKDQLRQNTEAAIQQGVFGVPSFKLDNQILWGHDRIAHLDYMLTHGDPIDLELVAEALATPAGIQRA